MKHLSKEELQLFRKLLEEQESNRAMNQDMDSIQECLEQQFNGLNI